MMLVPVDSASLLPKTEKEIARIETYLMWIIAVIGARKVALG